MIVIESHQLRAVISTLGAEMQQLTDKISGQDYLWHGDKKYWGGHSPILFPATGGLWNSEARIGGEIYKVPKHGFVSAEEWEILDNSASSVTLVFRNATKYASIYPFSYEVRVRYTLVGRLLKTDFEVFNKGNAMMYFQMGGHPGFVLPEWKEENEMDGYLRFEGVTTSVARAGDQGCMEMLSAEVLKTPAEMKRFPLPKTKEGLTPLCVETFAHEALIFNEQIDAVTVLDINKRPIATVRSTSPVWLFWSPQGEHSPFICCEPWYGLPDLQGFVDDISKRPYVQHAAPGMTWQGGYTLRCW